MEQIFDLAERTPDAFRAVIDESAFSGSERAFADMLLDKVSARVQRLRGDLGRSSSSAT